MDRNLGASRVATSLTDTEAYGDCYQWGRLTDGHEKRTSPTTHTYSNSVVPGHGNFILLDYETTRYDWLDLVQNNYLWQGVDGINNPCPVGFRLPTAAEWNEERLSWSSNDYNGALASPLKLIPTGHRSPWSGDILDPGTGFYWSSGTMLIEYPYESYWASQTLTFRHNSSGMSSTYRADGLSVRCIKD